MLNAAQAMAATAELAATEHDDALLSLARAARRRCCRTQTDQEHREDHRKRVDRRAHHQRQQPRPDDFRAERGQCRTSRS